MCYRHRTKQEMTVSVQESIFRVGDHKKKWLEFKYKPNGCNVLCTRRSAAVRPWQLSYGSLKLTSRNTIITPKGLWVLVRCFLRSFHSYAKNPSATCPQLFFSTQGKKKTFSSHSTKNNACLEDKLMIIWFTIWNQLIHTPQGKLCLLFSLKSFTSDVWKFLNNERTRKYSTS